MGVFRQVAIIESSDGSNYYQIKKDDESAAMRCSCLAFAFNREKENKKENRTCRHIEVFKLYLNDPLARLVNGAFVSSIVWSTPDESEFERAHNLATRAQVAKEKARIEKEKANQKKAEALKALVDDAQQLGIYGYGNDDLSDLSSVKAVLEQARKAKLAALYEAQTLGTFEPSKSYPQPKWTWPIDYRPDPKLARPKGEPKKKQEPEAPSKKRAITFDDDF
jgi:hypothetical protein